jgi:hypothetical protein
MRGVLLVEQAVVDRQLVQRGWANGRKRLPQIVAVDAFIDLHRAELQLAATLSL